MKAFWEKIKPYIGRIVCTVLGLTAAILFMTIGFWRTFLLLLCCAAGYVGGLIHDKIIVIPEEFYFWRF